MSDATETGRWVNHQTRELGSVQKGYTAFQEGDILFAKITPCMENGKGCHATQLNSSVGFGSTEFHVLRVKSDVSPRFIYHWLQSEPLRLKAEAEMTGSAGQRRVQVSFFERFEIARFDFWEQQQIAETLDTLDEAIHATRRLIGKLERTKDGLLHDLLTRGLDENGNLRNPEKQPEAFRDTVLGRLPIAWEVDTLGEVVKRSNGFIQTGPFGSQLHAYEYIDQGIPVIMPQDIAEGKIHLDQIARISFAKVERLSRHKVRSNDVVFARRGDLSRCIAIGSAEAGWVCGTGCLLVRVPIKHLDNRWLSAVYRFDYCQRQILARAVGSTMVNLNTSLLASLALPLPGLEEQSAICSMLDKQTKVTDHENAYLSKLETLKKGLMDDLLTGRVRLREAVERLEEVF